LEVERKIIAAVCASGSPADGSGIVGAHVPFRGDRRAVVKAWFALGRAGCAARKAWVQRGFLPVQVQGEALRVRIWEDVAVMGGRATCKVILHNLPPALAVSGCVLALLKACG
jgi:hypothetical protein